MRGKRRVGGKWTQLRLGRGGDGESGQRSLHGGYGMQGAWPCCSSTRLRCHQAPEDRYRQSPVTTTKHLTPAPDPSKSIPTKKTPPHIPPLVASHAAAPQAHPPITCHSVRRPLALPNNRLICLSRSLYARNPQQLLVPSPIPSPTTLASLPPPTRAISRAHAPPHDSRTTRPETLTIGMTTTQPCPPT